MSVRLLIGVVCVVAVLGGCVGGPVAPAPTETVDSAQGDTDGDSAQSRATSDGSSRTSECDGPPSGTAWLSNGSELDERDLVRTTTQRLRQSGFAGRWVVNETFDRGGTEAVRTTEATYRASASGTSGRSVRRIRTVGSDSTRLRVIREWHNQSVHLTRQNGTDDGSSRVAYFASRAPSSGLIGAIAGRQIRHLDWADYEATGTRRVDDRCLVVFTALSAGEAIKTETSATGVSSTVTVDTAGRLQSIATAIRFEDRDDGLRWRNVSWKLTDTEDHTVNEPSWLDDGIERIRNSPTQELPPTMNASGETDT